MSKSMHYTQPCLLCIIPDNVLVEVKRQFRVLWNLSCNLDNRLVNKKNKLYFVTVKNKKSNIYNAIYFFEFYKLNKDYLENINVCICGFYFNNAFFITFDEFAIFLETDLVLEYLKIYNFIWVQIIHYLNYIKILIYNDL